MQTNSNTFRFLVMSLLVVLFAGEGSAQSNRYIARGADTSEIYLSTYWYKVPSSYFGWGGIFRSTDNGKSLTMQHKFIYPSHMTDIFGDSTPGAIYLRFYAGFDTVMVSRDTGVTYSYVLTGVNGYGGRFISGCRQGEFFLGNESLSVHNLIRYTNYGDSMQITNNAYNDSLILMDAGTMPCELYAMQWPYIYDTLGIAYSNDCGQTFTVFRQDTGLLAYIEHYTWSRGTVPGEIYLVGLNSYTDRYHIFHSTDYGHTLELKYITDPWPEASEVVAFTAGRTPGSFYLMRSRGYYYYYNELWIYYSHDYGATYEVFYHPLDSTLSAIGYNEQLKKLSIYPVPSKDRIMIDAGESGIGNISIENMAGRELMALPYKESGTEVDISALQDGVYIILFKNKKTVMAGKFVKM